MHNRERDERQKARLRAMGWNVLTVWECQLRQAQRERTLAAVEYYINRSFLGMRGAVPLKGYDEGGGGYAVAAEGNRYEVTPVPPGERERDTPLGMICVHCAAIFRRVGHPPIAKLVKNPDITPAPTQISALCSQYLRKKQLYHHDGEE